MATVEYSLFRAKFIRPTQTSFLHADITTPAVFLKAIEERPSAELRRGRIWHIGNIRLFSENTGYFAVGRTTNATIEKFDETTGDFVEEELATSPYTHCVFDASLGLLGIAHKASLARWRKGVAARIQELLSKSEVVRSNDISVEVAPIPNPEGFLRALMSAYRVSRFTATFHGPNPFDADEYFQKPLAIYLSAANGVKGKAQINGEDLNRDVLKGVTRSTAATGNEASARIRTTIRHKPITINLKGDPVKRGYDEDDHQPEAVLEDLTQTYERVRNDEGN